MWIKPVLNDLKSHNPTLTEAVNMAEKRPLWMLLAVSDTMHSEWCKPEIDDDDLLKAKTDKVSVELHSSITITNILKSSY